MPIKMTKEKIVPANGEMRFASTAAGISAKKSISIFDIKAMQHKAAAPKMNNAEMNMPI